MAVKYLTLRVVTKPTKDGGRSVKLSRKNIAAVCSWLGEAFISIDLEAKGGPKLKLKTPKGPRVATLDDVVVKHGTRRNKGTVTFTVVKAS